MSVDVNLDSLRGFLEELQDKIGEHTKTLTVIQTDMQKKANEKTVSIPIEAMKLIVTLDRILHAKGERGSL